MTSITTNRYGDLLREFYEGIRNNDLSEPRLEEIVRIFNELSGREDKYSNWLGPKQDSAKFHFIQAYDVKAEIPLTRTAGFTGSSTSAPNATEVELVFTANRNFLGDTDLYVCATMDSNGKYFRPNQWTESYHPFLFFGDVSYDESGGSNTGQRILFLNFYDKNSVFGGSYYFSFTAGNNYGITHPFLVFDTFSVGGFVTLSYYQTSGITKNLDSANINFLYL